MHLTRLLTTIAFLVTFVSSAPTPLSVAPLLYPYVNLDRPLPYYGEFKYCTPQQQRFLETTVDDVHKLAALAFRAAQVDLAFESNRTTFQLFGTSVTLATDTANEQLTSWFGLYSGIDSIGNLVTFEGEERTKRLELIAAFYGKVESTLFNVNNRSLQFNCKPPKGTCNQEPGWAKLEMPVAIKPIPEAYKPWYQVQSVSLCPDFWNSPSIEYIIQRAEPLSGDEPMPAAYLLLAKLMPTQEDAGDILAVFGGCGHDADFQLNRLEPLSNRFEKAQEAILMCWYEALTKLDIWSAFALDIMGLAYRKDVWL